MPPDINAIARNPRVQLACAVTFALVLLLVVMGNGDKIPLPEGLVRYLRPEPVADVTPEPTPPDPRQPIEEAIDAYLLEPTPAARRTLVQELRPMRDLALPILAGRAEREPVGMRLREVVELSTQIGGYRAQPILVATAARTDLTPEVRSLLVNELGRLRGPGVIPQLLDWHADTAFAAERQRIVDRIVAAGRPSDLATLTARQGDATPEQRRLLASLLAAIRQKHASQKRSVAVRHASEAQLVAMLGKGRHLAQRQQALTRLEQLATPPAIAAIARAAGAPTDPALDQIRINAVAALARLAARPPAREALLALLAPMPEGRPRTLIAQIVARFADPAFADALPRDGWLATLSKDIRARTTKAAR